MYNQFGLTFANSTRTSNNLYYKFDLGTKLIYKILYHLESEIFFWRRFSGKIICIEANFTMGICTLLKI